MDTIEKGINKEAFMRSFRNDELLAQLTTDDRIEIFSQILVGSTDISKELLNSLLSDYNVNNLHIIEVENAIV